MAKKCVSWRKSGPTSNELVHSNRMYIAWTAQESRISLQWTQDHRTGGFCSSWSSRCRNMPRQKDTVRLFCPLPNRPVHWYASWLNFYTIHHRVIRWWLSSCHWIIGWVVSYSAMSVDIAGQSAVSSTISFCPRNDLVRNISSDTSTVIFSGPDELPWHFQLHSTTNRLASAST